MTNSDDEGQRWAERVVKTFGETAKRVRGKRSAKWLSDRTAALGYRVSPTVISKLDTGHRGSVLHLPEILVISAALQVSPVSLIFGHLPSGAYEIRPKVPIPSVDALNWFCSDGLPRVFIPAEMLESIDGFDADRVVFYSREMDRSMAEMANFDVEVVESMKAGDKERAEALRDFSKMFDDRYEDARRKLAELGADMGDESEYYYDG